LDSAVLTLDDDLVPSTGPSEGTNRWWDDHLMGMLHNRDVLSVIMKIGGVSAGGDWVYNIFYQNEKRWNDATKCVGMNIEGHLARSKAQFALLKFGVDNVELYNAETAYVHRIDDSCLVRHAEPSGNHHPPFPSSLERMRRRLKHAGPLAFSRAEEGWYTVDRKTGRCDCLASHRKGVRSSDGLCKHGRQVRFREELDAATSDAERGTVRSRWFSELAQHVHDREKSKGVHACRPLLEASTQGCSQLIDALATHRSIPPCGKTTAVDDAGPSTGSPPAATFAVESGVATFTRTTDLGLLLTSRENDDEPMLDELVVLQFTSLANGSDGPAAHSGHRLRPGDVITSASIVMPGQEESDAESIGLVSNLVGGAFHFPADWAEGTLSLTCFRPSRATLLPDEGPSNGGRPEQRKAKYPRQQGARLGGSRPRRGRKPQRTPASAREPLHMPPPCTGDIHARIAMVRANALDSARLQTDASALATELEGMTYVR